MDQKKNLTYYTDEYEWHSNRHNYVVNLGYNDEFMTDVRITFQNAGKYTFNSIEVFSLPMDSFADRAYSLYENGLGDVKMSPNKVEGYLEVEKPMLLCFSIPYSQGWTAKIDGIPTKLYQTNIKNLGVEVKAGNHIICIEYHTPLLREGWILSVLGFISFALISLHKKRCNHMTE